ncbi:hypothetical protein ACIQAA_21640 [Neobacillus sp. NPDC093182]|uniref:hypothetical protein n=1 Tax=Neobacillus sp. NPDC093182 TaxID=3364297 RepID=UPI00381B044A
MNQYHLYEWLKKQYIDFGFDYNLNEVIEMAEHTELSHDEIRDAYEDYKAALPNLQSVSFLN